jgi:hypothetical protein
VGRPAEGPPERRSALVDTEPVNAGAGGGTPAVLPDGL